MKSRLIVLLCLAALSLAACEAPQVSYADPNVSGVQARATLDYVHAVQTSTAQSQALLEWQATAQAAATQSASQATAAAARSTDESQHAAIAATQTQQAWSATATSDSIQATSTAAANATAFQWSMTGTQAAWDRQATAEAAGLQALQTAQAAQADLARLAAERQQTINQIQAAAPWVILAIVIPLIAYLAWIWGRAEALRRRVIHRDPRGDAPLLILDDHGRRNVIDPDLFFAPVISIGPSGQPEAPALAAPEYQAQLKARDQAVDLASRGLPAPGPRRRVLPAPASLPPAAPSLGAVRVVAPGEIKDWLSDVLPRLHRQAIEEGVADDE